MNHRDVLSALASLDASHPGQRFTTATIAREAGEDSRRAGKWTQATRENLYALMLAGLVLRPTGRPFHWQITPSGRERAERYAAA